MYIDPKLTAREKLALRGICKQIKEQTEFFCKSLNRLNESMINFEDTLKELEVCIKEASKISEAR